MRGGSHIRRSGTEGKKVKNNVNMDAECAMRTKKVDCVTGAKHTLMMRSGEQRGGGVSSSKGATTMTSTVN